MVPVKPNKRFEIRERRRKTADFYVKGWRQADIAHELGVAQATVSNDLKAVQQEWRESAIHDINLLRQRELQKLDRIERECWQEWERSKQPSQSAKVRTDGNQQKTEKQVTDQRGDVVYLDQIRQCVAARRAILGLDAPMEIAPLLPDGQDAAQVVVAQLSVTELRVLKRLKEKAAPVVDGEVIANGEVIDAADAACLVQD